MYGMPPMPSGYPGYMPPPPQPKKSLRWLWILLSVLGGLLVVGCGTCIFSTVYMTRSITSTSSSSTSLFSGPTFNLDTYYQEIEQNEYNIAYDHLSPDAIISIDGQDVPITSLAVFTTTEQGLITTFGAETRYYALARMFITN